MRICETCKYFKINGCYDEYESCENKECRLYKQEYYSMPVFHECEHYKPIELNNEDVRVCGEPKFCIGDKVKVINPYSGYYGDEFIVREFDFQKGEYKYKIGIRNGNGALSTWKNEKEIQIVISKNDKIDKIDELIEMLAVLRRKLEDDTIDKDVVNESIGFMIEDLNKLKI